ncbi:MAG: DUF3054 domain-containing protein [Acidimicrobiales bacterium]|jgi:hypothetical protein
MRRAWAIADLAAVVCFVGIGRSVHDHGLSLGGVASTAWPFVVGLACGWLALAVWRRTGPSFLGGLMVWISTVAFGMVLRVVAGQGIALAFVFVALGFLGAAMLGWRLIVGLFKSGT